MVVTAEIIKRFISESRYNELFMIGIDTYKNATPGHVFDQVAEEIEAGLKNRLDKEIESLGEEKIKSSNGQNGGFDSFASYGAEYLGFKTVKELLNHQ